MLPDTDLGPLVSARQKHRVLEYIDTGQAEGAKMVLGREEVPAHGHFVTPTIFTGCHPGMRIVREKIFGPVLSVLRFKDEPSLYETYETASTGFRDRSGRKISNLASLTWKHLIRSR